MFQVAAITKGYGGQLLFNEVSFRIDAGDRIGLVGPNGAGKTTLLRILAGEEQADDGDLAAPKGARIGYLPQEVRTRVGGTVLAEVMGAVPEIGEMETEMARLEAAMATAAPEKASELAQDHGDLLDRYQALDGYSHEARAREILAGLRFTDDQLEDPLSTLSGGWGMRVELGRLLLARPDLLLLDEPTNHLDLESLEWLESFLQDYPGAWVVVSHDRYFLNRMVNKIVDLSQTSAFVYPGNYDSFLKAREELEERLAKEAAQRQKRIEEIQEFIERFRYKASKARQAQSRVKMIEKLQKEAEELGPTTAPKRRRKTIRFKLPEPARSGDRVIQLDRVRKAYGENVVYESLSFAAQRGDKVALVGVNGAGKTTMLKLLAAQLRPDAGARELGANVTPYYFAQHQIDMLDGAKTVLAELWDTMPDESETRVRGVLGAFLFSGDDVDKTVAVLSGGEKSRLALAKMLARPANLLLLDEPTNHLDLESREVLEGVLADYKGTIVFISHDRYFINRIASRVAEIHVGGAVNDFPGDYDYYLFKREQMDAASAAPAQKPKKQPPKKKKKTKSPNQTEKKKKKKNAPSAKSAPAKSDARAHREASKKAAREESRRARDAERLEGNIATAEARIKEIDALLCDPDVYADAARCKELLAEREATEEKVTGWYQAWEALQA